MPHHLVLGCLIIAVGFAPKATIAAIATAADPGAKPEASAPMPAGGQTIEHNGKVFQLASSTVHRGVSTDEYTVGGEKLAAWTELVTVQHLALAGATDAEAFLAYFKTRVADDGASVEVVSQAKAAAVFAVRFPKSEETEEQVMVCLAIRDAAKPSELNIIQYAIKPGRFPVAVTAVEIKSWRDRFAAQAQLLGSK